MRKIAAIALLLCLCLAPPAGGVSGSLQIQPSVSTVAENLPSAEEGRNLPEGSWWLMAEGDWRYVIAADIRLTEEQVSMVRDTGLVVAGNVLPARTPIPLATLDRMYPAAASDTNAELPRPELAYFELSGQWFYDSNDVLCYQHADGEPLMTVDEVFAALNASRQATNEEKIIYLTIDDSPSAYTMDLLAMLDAIDVKATFFVLGAYVDRFPIFLRAIHEQGHTIANHSYSHDASVLSSSFSSCLADFRRCEEAVEDALGFPLEMRVLRIPYGASTIPTEYRAGLQKNGYLWIDWNALNGDAEDDITTDAQALQRAISTAARNEGAIVMLVHDGKRMTIRMLEEMVLHFRAQGYTFRTLTPDMAKIPGMRMGTPQ